MPPMIIGHRGARRERPENTQGSLLRAIDLGVDGVEFDIRVSRDGIPVLMHDPDLNRVLGRPERVEDLSVEELTALELPEPAAVEMPPGAGIDSAGPGHRVVEPARIPRLAAVLDRLDGWNGQRLLELKAPAADRAGLVGAVARVIAGRSGAELVVLSFDLEVLEEVARQLPGQPRGVIISGRPSEADWRRAVELGTEVVVVRDRLVTPERVEWLAGSGRCVDVYPVNDPEAARELARLPVSGLITDDPRTLVAAGPFGSEPGAAPGRRPVVS